MLYCSVSRQMRRWRNSLGPFKRVRATARGVFSRDTADAAEE
jgi:hypothetical protein